MGKLEFKYIKKSFEEEGYTLLSTEYVNNKSYLKYICPNGHKHKIAWNNWNSGVRCKKCHDENKKILLGFINESFKKEGYTLLSKKYINSWSYLKYKCPKGHIRMTTWDNWNSGKSRCKDCNDEGQKLDFEIVKKSFKKENCILLSKKYINSKSYLKYRCINGKNHKIKYSDWNSGYRCKCFTIQISRGEKEVVKYVKSLGIKVKENDRTILLNTKTDCMLELDMYMPELNKAIEYNGDYWHSKNHKKTTDTLKKRLCKKLAIKLLTIKESEWKSNSLLCKKIIKKFLF